MRVTHRLIPKTCEPPVLCLFACLVFALLVPTSEASGAEFIGKVVGITDGDTIKVLHEGKAERIRLSGIDCPEKKQSFGTRAKQFTSEHAFGKTVTVQPTGGAHRGRTIAEVILPNGRSLNQELLKAGLAWWYRKYSKDVRLGALENEARLAKRGLWVDPQPVPPWEWRSGRVPIHTTALSGSCEFYGAFHQSHRPGAITRALFLACPVSLSRLHYNAYWLALVR